MPRELTRSSLYYHAPCDARRAAGRGRLMILDIVAPSSALLATHLQTIQLLREASHVRNYSWNEWHARFSEPAFELKRTRPGKLRLEFDAWAASMQTAADRITMIRSLLESAPQEVRVYPKGGADSSFPVAAIMTAACVRTVAMSESLNTESNAQMPTNARASPASDLQLAAQRSQCPGWKRQRGPTCTHASGT
jgi:hypothetical protein